MKLKAKLMDEAGMNRAITRIAHEIIERNCGTDDIVLIGIRTRGVPIAYRIRDKILHAYDVSVPVGILDAVPYRDDIILTDKSRIDGTNVPFLVDGIRVVIVDDVLYTGRTVRAAIEGIMKIGRPSVIQLAVMVDRGHRELPIRPDFVGKNTPTSLNESVSVKVLERDDEDSILLFSID